MRVKQVFRVVIKLLFLCYLLICLCEQVFDSLFGGARIYAFLTEFLTELFFSDCQAICFRERHCKICELLPVVKADCQAQDGLLARGHSRERRHHKCDK